jgi:hypothetical protein
MLGQRQLSRYRNYFAGNHRHERTVIAAFAEHYFAIDESEQRVVLAHAYVLAGVVLGAALTHDDVAGNEGLATEDFYAETFGMRFAAVVGRADTFLVSHGI